MHKIWAFFCLICSLAVQAELSQPIQGTLDNGLRYTLLPLHQEKGHIEIRMKVYAGSVDENDDQAGVAHMVEHLVFRATEKYPNGLMPYLHANKWVRGKNYNAVTSNDNTTYMLTPPKESNLTQSLEVLAQMLFHAKLHQADLDDERKIILEEWRAGLGVAARMNRARTNVVRMDSRYTRHPVIGTEESIRAMPAEQLRVFYKRWYTPNNMQLLIVGDIEPANAEQLINAYFGMPSAQPLPQRDYLEPTLSNNFRTVQLQDEQSGSSQIAYIVRFDETSLRGQDEQARYARLLDRLALATVTQRLRNQKSELPNGVRSLVIRKSDIGHKTAALGIFASVDEQSHRQGLRQIFQEIERLKRFPISEVELAKQKAIIQGQIDNAKKHNGDRDFSGWVQTMVESVLSDKPYFTQPEIAELTEPLLAKIGTDELNRHIQTWFASQDRIVQYQAPRLTQIVPISVDFAKNLQQQTASQQISAPNQEKIIEPMALDDPRFGKGGVINRTHFASENVTYFTLSNGDRVVWLNSPLANGKTYLEARSDAGFRRSGLGDWQSQIAVQMIAQNAPQEWQMEQLNRWKTLNNVNLSLNQKADYLSYHATVENDKLADLLRLYLAYQLETEVKEGWDETKAQLIQNLAKEKHDSLEHRRISRLNLLRYGKENLDLLPDKQSLEALSEQDLNQIWTRLRAEPTTFYLLSDLPESEIIALISKYLAPIPRNDWQKIRQIKPLTGREIVRFPFNLEPKDEVRIWFFQEQDWQGKDAVLVSLLKPIIANKLKLALRDQSLGIYSLRFESTLNPQTERIESELSFSSDPQKSDMLIALAESVLSSLSESISEEEIRTAKAQFLQGEKERLKLPHAWLNRLILSDSQFDSPRYLSEVEHLAENITLESMQTMAQRVYNKQNVKVFITTPK